MLIQLLRLRDKVVPTTIESHIRAATADELSTWTGLFVSDLPQTKIFTPDRPGYKSVP